ncbi:LOW QUALITY PROTEIN: protein kinase STUNTED-like [Diospyros lotus]|uniref:LOW QUALITY PROTEIN: protein kinase STUNTED-like n=1 Tax=Diospyros lotus TaxID=55363 RepID=UPI002257CD0B|nr:LOW QUALITY PROTEIN: protein kinase STUNTED-like [Diospyros lotus]
MKLSSDCSAFDSEERDGNAASSAAGSVVVVGVRLLDSKSRELLTWALVKVARSGDRVIALHVVNPDTEGKSTLLSLVKTFDSVLAAYEGFCHLKQVDLKLKLCRGSSVRKGLVQQAKSYGVAKVIVGTSKTHHKIRSSVSVAKYCAKNLPRNFSVLAVDNGKILFQRQADNDYKKHYVQPIHDSLNEQQEEVLNNGTADAEASKSNEQQQLFSQKFNFVEESSNGANLEDSLALVPARNQLLIESKHGWTLLRQVFLRHQQQPDKASLKKKSVMQWLLNLHDRQAFAAVPHCKKSNSDTNKDHLINLDGENGLIVPCRTNNASSLGYCLKGLSKELEALADKYASLCRIFNYQELMLATSNFKSEHLVGKGGSSQVYRGFLPGGKEVAVKVLKASEEIFRQFVSEVEITTTLHHKNTISLLGFCFGENNLLLVYNFLSRGSLEENLHGTRKSEIVLSWEDRYKVAVGVAEALDYLHNGLAEPVIHRDVKSSNILLSDDFEPQLSDFGLALWASDSSQNITCTDIAGTFGYLAPEYFMHGKVNDRIDVYAFGVILFELLSGRKPIDNVKTEGQQSLVLWASSIMKGGKVSELMDPSLGSNYDGDQSERMILAAALCIRRAPLCRPQIDVVLKLLQGDADTIKWARKQVSALEEENAVDGEEFPANMQSHLNIALLDLEEESLSTGSTDHIDLIEDYLNVDGAAHRAWNNPFFPGLRPAIR